MSIAFFIAGNRMHSVITEQYATICSYSADICANPESSIKHVAFALRNEFQQLVLLERFRMLQINAWTVLILVMILLLFRWDIHKETKKAANHGLESTGAPPAAETPETHP